MEPLKQNYYFCKTIYKKLSLVLTMKKRREKCSNLRAFSFVLTFKENGFII